MTQEQKARAYDEVREKIALRFGSNVAEEIFSEFEETEDEKIRKALIYDIAKQGEQTDKIVERAKTEKQRVLITESDGEANIDWDTRSLQDVKLLLEYGLDYINKLDEKNCLSNTKPSMGDLKIISSLKDIIYGYWNSLPDSALEENEVAESCYRWLEKQCEKFKVGDWIVDNCNNVWQVVEVSNNFYRLKNINESESLPKIKWVNETFHLWSIKDAKDGDVLIDKNYMGESPFIFKETKPSNIKTDVPNPLTVFGYCGIGGAGFTKSSGWGDTANCIYYPATIEQRDILFAKMHEAGYMWDSKSKQLLSLKAEPSDIQTPTGWSEEDESIISDAEVWLDTLCDYLKGSSSAYIPKVRNIISKLKSLKDGVQPQSQWKPSEEQMKALHDMNLTGNISYVEQGQILIELYNDLKKL